MRQGFHRIGHATGLRSLWMRVEAGAIELLAGNEASVRIDNSHPLYAQLRYVMTCTLLVDDRDEHLSHVLPNWIAK